MTAFLPAGRDEMAARGWRRLDVILVTGDAYLDLPASGVAVIGRVLEAAGFRVGIIAQPDVTSGADFTRLGEPRLFWGVSSGAVDSMVANYTASGRRRRTDDFTPGGRNDRRPDRAVIVYANAIRRYWKKTAPIVLGGVEASLRRLAHYDWWSDRVRRSILLDAKADFLLYGMADDTVVELARLLAGGLDPRWLPGLCYVAPAPPAHVVRLPSFEACRDDPTAAITAFQTWEAEQDPCRGRVLAQPHGDRWLVHNPPPPPLTTERLDAVYELPYTRDLHPRDGQRGPVRALETVRFSLTSHRGCYGGCSFCAIAVHQGRAIQNRSIGSLEREARSFTRHPAWRGVISDVGGATANMYGIDCDRKTKAGKGACAHRQCLFPAVCPRLRPDHGPQLEVLARLRKIPGVRRVFVASGVRPDLVLADETRGQEYLEHLVAHHVSGQLKVAPEHVVDRVLALMGKPPVATVEEFRRRFLAACRAQHRRFFLTYYFIAAHPGCTAEDMAAARRYCGRVLRLYPEQVQIFTPTPATRATLMYHTGREPVSGAPLYVARDGKARQRQKEILVGEKDGRGGRRTAAGGGRRARGGGGRR